MVFPLRSVPSIFPFGFCRTFSRAAVTSAESGSKKVVSTGGGGCFKNFGWQERKMERSSATKKKRFKNNMNSTPRKKKFKFTILMLVYKIVLKFESGEKARSNTKK
ncbi:MAG TPA: hypothetical protein ENK14_13835 [Caldithrix sp.]|nr:hypothetical protein [Caldithrix sp.]